MHPQQDTLEELLKEVIRAKGTPAAEDCLLHLHYRLHAKPCSTPEIVRSLQALTMYMRPKDLDAMDVRSLDALVQCLISLVGRGRHGVDQEPPGDLELCLKKLWPILWAWLKAMFHRCAEALCSIEMRLAYRLAFAAVLSSMDGVRWMKHQLLLPTADLYAIVIQVWKLDIAEPILAVMVGQDDTVSIASVLDTCFIVLADEPEEVWNQKVLSEFEGGAQEFASTLLAHWQNDSRAKLPNLHKLIFDTHVITIAMSHPSVADALLQRNCIVDAIKHLSSLTKRTKDERGLVARAMEYCLFNIFNAFQMGEGTPNVLQGLNSHLLESVAACAPWSEEIEPSVFAMISEYIPSYLIYRSVVSCASRALRKVSIHSQSQMTGILLRSWTTLTDMIKKAVALAKAANNADPEHLLRELCNNVTKLSVREIFPRRNSSYALDAVMFSSAQKLVRRKVGSTAITRRNAKSIKSIEGVSGALPLRQRHNLTPNALVGSFLPLGEPRDQLHMRRVVRATISSHSADIARSIQSTTTRPFIIDIDFRDFPPVPVIQYSQSDPPGHRCIHMTSTPPPIGWNEAWSRANFDEDLLVIRNTIPAGRAFVVFLQVMLDHQFQVPKSAGPPDGNDGERSMKDSACGRDDIFIASHSEDNVRAVHKCQE
ncbi:hypothetical protein HWV62_27237 [Athelia sp. TMB]|nr:hypothetical protein HWV62_27237 [Athelia sp. TMB]